MEPASHNKSDSLACLLVDDPAAAADIEWVLYVQLAWLVQLQQQQLSRAHASSSSRGQQQQSMRQQRVPPWHVQFLAAVGVPAWRAEWRQIPNVSQAMLEHLETLHCLGRGLEVKAMLLTAGGRQGSSNSSGSCVCGGGESGNSLPSQAEQHQSRGQESAPGPVSQQRSYEELLPARETLLLLLEVILLHPGVTTIILCCPAMQNLWRRMQPTSASADARETADTMLQPLLHLLGAAVLQQLETTSSGSSSSSDDATPGGRSEDFARWFAYLAEWLVAAGATPLQCKLHNGLV
jgi:hypothetical protein